MKKLSILQNEDEGSDSNSLVLKDKEHESVYDPGTLGVVTALQNRKTKIPNVSSISIIELLKLIGKKSLAENISDIKL